MRVEVSLTVNGQACRAVTEARTHLADLLRETHGLTGTHLGCEHGVCGACTVMVDGRPVRSCTNFAITCEGARVMTIEGFDHDPLMRSLQAAFKRHHALQCGFCTPGMLITAYDIVRRIPAPDEKRVRRELAGNLCRCTGYQGIVEAILAVAASHADEPLAALVAPLPAPPAIAASHGQPLPEPASGRASPLAVGRLVERHGDEWHLRLGVPAVALWNWLQAPEAVMRCLPGATLTGGVGTRGETGQRLSFIMTVAIGPMRASFEGAGTVRFNVAERSGELTGSGHDVRSRTRVSGAMTFRVVDEGTRSLLCLGLDYQLQGDLAQYSRGAVVDAVTEQLLIRFAENVGRAVAGEHFEDQSEISGASLARAAFWQKLKRFFV